MVEENLFKMYCENILKAMKNLNTELTNGNIDHILNPINSPHYSVLGPIASELIREYEELERQSYEEV